jgi:uncharacterized secreted protein with C-terminal beta-propeller domain
MKLENKFFLSALILLLIVSILTNLEGEQSREVSKITKFKSGEELVKAFEDAKERGGGIFGIGGLERTIIMKSAAVVETAQGSLSDSGRDYSETNIQVKGVDEADIIKTDGDYIYTLTQGNLIIIKAYPADEVEILSTTRLKNFNPRELFIHKDRLLIFGSTSYDFRENEQKPKIGEPISRMIVEKIMPYSRYIRVMSVKLYDISNRENPKLLRTIDFEGSYLTSRKIGENVYFVVNSYPHYYREKPRPLCEEIIPLYREINNDKQPKLEDMHPIVKCTDIGYIEPIQASNFITIASISMSDEDKNVEKEVIVGSGQNVYASLENLYIAQTSWPRYNILGKIKDDYVEKTVITKFVLDNGKVRFLGTGEVAGHILNQFSMDEYDSHFRIATTIGSVWDKDMKSSNNVYILDDNLEVVGKLEDLAPGEKIYSVRFMGKKGYVVTFKKVDPLFVIDLSNHENPLVLGKLKIPGYSDYLHPYDETHLIGIGKQTVEADEEQKQERGLDFAWYQGIKMAIFDVSDVENPIEMHKVVIGDRGTDSDALRDHKAFLFDKKKNLLVIPITLAEIKGEKTRDNQYGKFVFQGAYVYDITLENGFELKGRVTHYDDNKVYKKSGFYFNGNNAIRRSLYIENVLYTLSNTRLQLNDLNDLKRLKVLELV